MIATGSRYSQSRVVVANNLDGKDIQAIVPGQQSAFSVRFSFYQVKQFDKLVDIAYVNYGDPTLWWVIADANPEIMLWDSIPIGSIIRVPVNAS